MPRGNSGADRRHEQHRRLLGPGVRKDLRAEPTPRRGLLVGFGLSGVSILRLLKPIAGI